MHAGATEPVLPRLDAERLDLSVGRVGPEQRVVQVRGERAGRGERGGRLRSPGTLRHRAARTDQADGAADGEDARAVPGLHGLQPTR